MAICFTFPLEFRPNDRVVSLVYHPPEIEPGTKATIVSPRIGDLYAVQLPDGNLHRWFAGFELQSINNEYNYLGLLCPGSFARIKSTEGHPPHIKAGTIVKIVKVLGQTDFYDLIIDGKGYHRWLAGFELAALAMVSQNR